MNARRTRRGTPLCVANQLTSFPKASRRAAKGFRELVLVNAAALAAGRIEAEIEIRAQAVRYVPERDAIEIVTSRNSGFLIPRQWIGALQDVPTNELSKLEVWPDGSAIELEDRDIQISVQGLLTAILPAMLPSRSVAAIFASRGGQATSRAKRKSSRANGRKGGRPRKKDIH